MAACVPARECLGREPSSSSCVRVPCSGVGVAVSDNTDNVGGGRSRRREGLGTASHCGAVRSLHSVTVRGITFRQLASQHTTPSHVWHHSFCFSAVRRIGVRAGQSPHGSHFSPGVSIGMSCRSSRVDGNEMFRLFAGRDALAVVASFLSGRAIGRLLCSAKHFCDEEGIWSTLLRRVSRAVSALSVKSARSSVSRMVCGSCGIWPRDGRLSYVQLSNYRWCLDLCYAESQVFSAVIPLQAALARNDAAFHSSFRGDFAGSERIANLLSVDQLPSPALRLIHSAWNGITDPVLHSPGFTCDQGLLQEFRPCKLTCSLWLFSLDSRQVLAGICRDPCWGSGSSCFRFYIAEGFPWLDVRENWSVRSPTEETDCESTRVLEIWVPFRCSCNVAGNYDLSCSIEMFVAHGLNHPEDPRHDSERERADAYDLTRALSGCTRQPGALVWGSSRG